MSGLYYKDEFVEIWHGDAREIVPTLPKVDLVLTDPPYGIKVVQHTYRNKKSKPGRALAHKTFYDVSHEWDDQPPDSTAIAMIRQVASSVILWGGNYFEVPPSSCWLVWDKVNGSNDFADCELAWTNLTKAVRKFRWQWNGMLQENMADKDTREHPTQKPLALMKWCLSLVPDARMTLDPYLGSGTTLRAAKDLGRRAIGIEIDERYCEIAARRCNEAQPSLYHLLESSERQGGLLD
jgi:DNA modification methylase